MAGFLSMKMKRKDLEDVYDEFSEFSLSSPARKIRRLDADLPPIMEEEPAIPPVFGQPSPDEHLNVSTGQLGAAMEEAAPSLPLNEERALVLYKPVNMPFLQSSSSSNISLKVNTELIPGFKNHHQHFWLGHPNIITEVEDDEASMDENLASTNHCLAVVPWVPSQLHADHLEINGLSEPMDTEEAGAVTMEVEEENPSTSVGGQEEARVPAGMGGGDGLQQWQQHCLTPQIPQSTSTPIMWSW
ncbi:uncharacterized protein LOC131217506 [Magnolia sinica]|uniref:uncharacterized protein LOC131217506 n=1 Tax=Magnolia sinica TaxID=86752 RepID=UPI00265A13C0|nr:uncharacterized protein LOC131217506 [Magnolia sinica]